ncbi:MauE/DoxX family redox-associated membrane protein, partial [Zoogloea sp.]|uniref:MauE/DoxX family redox-associated membrane protein n=1 Tax=Zoogloea sp. TaxID=49181 RepID=UPI0031FDC907
MNKIAFFLRIILSASMILAGGTKIINPTDFSSVLVYSIHFSETAGALIATILPVLELLSGLLVLFPGISGRVGIIIIRCLLFIFLVFHILNLLLNFSTNNCFCYGLLFDFSNTQMLVIVLILFGISCLHIQRFYRIETAKISSDLKIFTKSDFLFAIIVFVFFVFSLSIRYQHIRKDSDSGIISKSENIFFQERIKNILESLSS